MKTTAVIASLLIAVTGVVAQGFPTPFTSARSMSGQFVVFGPNTRALRPMMAATNGNWVSLEPTLVTVSAERIRQAAWRELGVTGSWQNKISVMLHPARFTDEIPNVVADHSLGVWNYRVEMPDQITKDRYLRAMVQVVLLELANRDARGQSAEIPAWLTEGLTYQLLANHGPDLVINAPRLHVNGVTYTPPATTDARPISSLERAHKILLGDTPFTFEELSWPAPRQIDGSDGPRYRACAQLFTCELLKLPGGRDCMREFIGALPSYLNWQMAFLQGFKPHFTRPLDIEKWWALQSTGFAGRDLIQTWTYEDSWNKLAAALMASVDVFGNTNELPLRAEVKLQTIVRDWEPAKREAVLRGKVGELESLRTRIAPELLALTADYSQTIAVYLKPRGMLKGNGQRDLLNRLDALDARLAKMSPRAPVANQPVAGLR